MHYRKIRALQIRFDTQAIPSLHEKEKSGVLISYLLQIQCFNNFEKEDLVIELV